jgi:hypothetical protein
VTLRAMLRRRRFEEGFVDALDAAHEIADTAEAI